MSSFAEKLKQQEAEAKQAGYASSGGSQEWFKIREGDNVVRVLTSPELIFERYLQSQKKSEICYTDCGYEGRPRFMCYLGVKELDLDGTEKMVIKLAKLPWKVGSAIAEYESDEDYTFESFPMPYNIKIKAKNAGTTDVEYNVIASPNRSEVPASVLAELEKMNTVPEIIEKMKDKQKEEHIKSGQFQANQEHKKEVAQGIEAAKANAGSSSGYEYPSDEGLSADDIPF